MTPDTLETMAEAYIGLALYASLHDGPPGTTGANEVAGTTRQPITWNTTATPGQRLSDPLEFTGLAVDTELTHVGFWTLATGGDFVDFRVNAMSLPGGGDYSFSVQYTQQDAA